MVGDRSIPSRSAPRAATNKTLGARDEASYRELALKLFPWICARCAREFDGKRLRELTVHHKDHNHDHNPRDGSNWELLCLYCHDAEHSRYLDQEWQGAEAPGGEQTASGIWQPFAGLGKILKRDT